MMPKRLLMTLSVLAGAAAPCLAQLRTVIPYSAATTAGNSFNVFPWGTAASSWPGVRVLACYDAANFTNAGITGPIVIQELAWRANDYGSTVTWTGGTFSNATVALSTAAVNYTGVSTTWASNHGADYNVVYDGPVTVLPGSGNGVGVPGPYHVRIPLQTPFLYNPSAGDLCIDTDFLSGAFSGGTLMSMDIDASAAAMASRVHGSASYPNANGTTQNHGIVVEVTYSRVSDLRALSTTMNANNANGSGGGVYFDVDVAHEGGVAIEAVSFHAAGNPGTPCTFDLWVRDGTAFGFEHTTSGWREVGDAIPFVSAGAGQASTALIPPLLLLSGHYGFAISVTGTGQAYTNGSNTYTDGALTITTGTANSVALSPSALFTPRTWNGTLHYRTADRALGRIGRSPSLSNPGESLVFTVAVTHPAGVRLTGLELRGVGSTASDSMTVWTCDGEGRANAGNPGVWRQAGFGAAPFRPPTTGTRTILIPFPRPIHLAQGVHGIALCGFSSRFRVWPLNSTGPAAYQDPFLAAHNCARRSTCLGPGTTQPTRMFDGRLHYEVLDPDLLQLQFNGLNGFHAANTAIGTPLALAGRLNHQFPHGDPGRSTFRGNEPGAGMLGRNTFGSGARVVVDGSYGHSGSLTVAWWQRRHTSPAGITYVYTCLGAAPFLLSTDGTPGIGLTYETPGTGALNVLSNMQSPLGVWQHVAMVVDDNQGRIDVFLDGRRAQTTPIAVGSHGFTQFLGAYVAARDSAPAQSDHTRYFDLDDFRVYGIALTEAEIHRVMQGENASAGVYGTYCPYPLSAAYVQATGGLPDLQHGNPDFAVELVGAGPGEIYFNVTGLFPMSYGVLPLPQLGTGCELQVDPLSVLIGITDANGSARRSFATPAAPGLSGLHFYSQYLLPTGVVPRVTLVVDIHFK